MLWSPPDRLGRYLHARGMVHKDLKSPNVLVDGHGRAKVSDFGSSSSLQTLAMRSATIGCPTRHPFASSNLWPFALFA